jgi:hypothetical protein
MIPALSPGSMNADQVRRDWITDANNTRFF